MQHTASQPSINKQQNLMSLVLVLALIKFVLPYFIQAPVYEPHRDEFLYLAEGRHLAWGYLEVPPMMSILGYFSNLMGGNLFWIRFWPSLFGAITYILVARLILMFGGRWFALILGFMPFVLGYYMHLHFMFQPNFLEVFFWTLMAYGIIRYIKTDNIAGLYIAGIALGLGMMSKYSVLFFAVGLFIGLLLTKERKLLLNKHFYLAILAGLIIFSPNILWQWLHGFPVLHQMKELQNQQLEKMSQLNFLADQVFFNLPCLFTWVAGLCWVAFSPAGKPYRFIAWGVVIAIIIIVAGHGKGYYGMGAYPVLFGFGAVGIERWTAGRLLYLRYVMVAFSLIAGCYLDTVTLPFLPPRQLIAYYEQNPLFKKMGFLTWEDQKDHPLPQDFADMLGWKELTVKTAKAYHAINQNEKSKPIIICDNYGEAGAVDYYRPPYQLPQPMGHAASYLFWTPADFSSKADNFILTTDYRPEIHEDFIKEFQSATVVDSITNPYSREFGSYIIVFKKPSEKFRKVWQDHYESLKQGTASR